MFWRILCATTVLVASGTANAEPKKARAKINAEAPRFELPVVQGQASGKLADHRGKVVVLKFWATYCGYCKSIRPALIDLAKANPKAISVLAISFQGTGKLKRYLRKHTIGLPVLHDRRGPVSRRYRARATPTLSIIDQCGTLRWQRSGAGAIKAAIKVATKLVETPPPCAGDD